MSFIHYKKVKCPGPDYDHNLRGAITFIEAFSPKTISFFSSDLLIFNKYKLK
jgi:hypothetical protein